MSGAFGGIYQLSYGGAFCQLGFVIGGIIKIYCNDLSKWVTLLGVESVDDRV